MECAGLSRLTGRPCHRHVSRGFLYCCLHGGSVPGAKLVAERAMAVLRLPAIEALHRILADWALEDCPTCGRIQCDPSMLHPIVKTAIACLDRTGLGPRSTLEVVKTAGDADLDVDALTDDERLRLGNLLGQLSALKTEVRMRLAPPVVDVIDVTPSVGAPIAQLAESLTNIGEDSVRV